jgi:hypothetical protein
LPLEILAIGCGANRVRPTRGCGDTVHQAIKLDLMHAERFAL